MGQYDYTARRTHRAEFRPYLMLRAAALLERDARNPEGVQFDLGTWSSPAEEHADHHVAGNHSTLYWHRPDVYEVLEQENGQLGEALEQLDAPKVDCGTRACAMGLFAISGEFKADGLTHCYIAHNHTNKLIMLLPKYGRSTGFDAAAQFFGITQSDASYLFDPGCYENVPKEAEGELEVAERIRKFVEGYVDARHHGAFPDDAIEDEDIEFSDSED